jgi:WD40 repeat protein
MVKLLAGHADIILGIRFSPDGKTLASCGVDNTIKFWDTTTWNEIPPSISQMEFVTSVAFSPDGRNIATACADGFTRLWSVATRRELAALNVNPAVHYVQYITFSPDGQILAAWDGDNLLHLWRAPIPDNNGF